MEQDSSPRQRRRYHELLRSLTPQQRLEKAISLSGTVRTLAVAGIGARHRGASEEEVRARLAVRLFGGRLAARLGVSLPPDAV